MTGSSRLRETLAEAVAELAGPRRLTVIEVAGEGVVAFDLHRDEAGTPRGRGRTVVHWADQKSGASSWARQAVTDAVPDGSTLIVVDSSPGGRQAREAMEWMRDVHPQVPAFVLASGLRVKTLLREVVADEPLRRSYELVVLKRHPVTARLEFTCRPLFTVEARRGDSLTFTVRCEPSDDRGTVFAVAAWQDRYPALLSVQTAKVPPGPYEVTAELERPGRVRFPSLPEFTGNDRTWAELVASVPSRLASPAGPAHLICAVEISGTGAQVRERLRRIGQVIAVMPGGPESPLRMSLIAYGAHSYQRGTAEEPVDVAAWHTSRVNTQYALERLEGRIGERGVSQGYAGAAMLEDMLAEVAGRLPAGGGERTVLLTVGECPPHPPRAHRSEILPCPRRIDWKQQVRRLEQHPGLTFGAICDQPSERADPVWSRLGRSGLAHLDAVDVRKLGAGLGLTASEAQPLPFPLIEVP
ncbi:hypothetical protein GCM10017673_28160 [Streptosporangium violaceochromogenes]|nr:hypothetical protein GCM10017673_28160 [Streptosporangium violaceochromogenes]